MAKYLGSRPVQAPNEAFVRRRDSSKALAHVFRITTSTTRVRDPRSGYVDSAQSCHHPPQFIVRSRRRVEGAQSYDAKESGRQRTERITGLYARSASVLTFSAHEIIAS